MSVPIFQQTPWQQSSECDPAKAALVVIDVLGGSEGAAPGTEEMAANCVKLAKACRAKGVPVIFVSDTHVKAYDREIELWGEHGMAGTEGCKPLDEFEVAETDILIPKRRYNAFFQTDLDLTLSELGVDTLIACGWDTNICVLQTLAGAYFLGYRSIVPADATVALLTDLTKEDGLKYFTRCYDTRVADTETVLGYLA
ncbi:MAG: cysteine hydrolase family protein [Coriobacteriales bacterium]|jgi:nicotinamidase-related amidase